MDLLKYDAIENIENSGFISKLSRSGLLDGEWVVTEKVHGANFSIAINAQHKIQCFRRNGVVNDSENFYNHHQIIEKNRKKLESIYDQLNKESDNEKVVRIFGELFGGIFPDTEPQGMKVQIGVFYAPFNEFMVFDILNGDKWLTFNEMVELCASVNLFCTEPLMTGTFEEAMEYDPHFETTIPARLNIEQAPDNIAEGIVIKPMIPKQLPNGTRVIIKKKNDRFREITGDKKKPPAKAKAILQKKSDKFNELYLEITRYFNRNRLDAVISKLGPVTKDNTAKLRGLLAGDAFNDFMNFNKEAFGQLSQNEQKTFKTEIQVLSTPVINEYFKEEEKLRQQQGL